MGNTSSNYYCPYMRLQDGTFAPHPTGYWEELGKNPEGYRTTDEFYRMADPDSFKSFSKSVDKIITKAFNQDQALPVGTVHTFKDGKEYKKIAENKWALADKANKKNKHAEIESHAKSVNKVQSLIDEKKKADGNEKSTKKMIKEEFKAHIDKQHKPKKDK